MKRTTSMGMSGRFKIGWNMMMWLSQPMRWNQVEASGPNDPNRTSTVPSISGNQIARVSSTSRENENGATVSTGWKSRGWRQGRPGSLMG
jgi:hypothetical protein